VRSLEFSFLTDEDACKTVGQLIAERSKDAAFFFCIAFNPKKNEEIEGCLWILLNTTERKSHYFCLDLV
jgi:large subunit ribosomal protein L18